MIDLTELKRRAEALIGLDDIPLAPDVILALIADIEDARNGMKHSCAIRLKKRIELLETQRDQLIADNERLTKAVGLQVIRRFVGDDDQKNIDELVAAGIQVDKELIIQLKAENERLKTLRSTTERDLAQELEVWRHGPSCWNCGDTGDVHDMVGEWLGQCDCNAAKLIDVSSERDQLRAEIAGLKTGYEAYERVNAELKAEVEALRRERAGKILCDLELFETLRDSANTEADEHRQCMATYRPLRQASLDSVVKKCDDLLAALGKGEQS